MVCVWAPNVFTSQSSIQSNNYDNYALTLYTQVWQCVCAVVLCHHLGSHLWSEGHWRTRLRSSFCEISYCEKKSFELLLIVPCMFKLPLYYVLRSNDAPYLANTATVCHAVGMYWPLTTTCLLVSHLTITPGCIICACLNIYKVDFGHTGISWPRGEIRKAVSVEDNGLSALSVNQLKPTNCNKLLLQAND